MSDQQLLVPKPKARKLFFAKQVNQETIEEISKEIVLINENDRLLENLYNVYDLTYIPKPIEIYIDSYGGLVYQAMGLIGIMEKSITPIHTICTGAAMSCGFIMLICGHKRFCYEHATPLYHQVSTSGSGEIEWMEKRVEEAKRLQAKFEEITLRKTKISKKKLDKVRKQQTDWYMSAEKALKLGVVDEII